MFIDIIMNDRECLVNFFSSIIMFHSFSETQSLRGNKSFNIVSNIQSLIKNFDCLYLCIDQWYYFIIIEKHYNKAETWSLILIKWNNLWMVHSNTKSTFFLRWLMKIQINKYIIMHSSHIFQNFSIIYFHPKQLNCSIYRISRVFQVYLSYAIMFL